MVDEWHILFQSYLFRNHAVTHLLDTASKFDNVTYVSATPIERDYWLEELKPFPEYRIEWPNAEKIHLKTYKTDDPLSYMASMCQSRIKEGGESNYHVFLNSVKGISRIIRLANLTPENTRIVCSDSNSTNRLPAGFDIAKTTDEVKTINFYTSTCFEGQDIYDKNGRSFIVSEGYRDHTKIDISTTMIQICGRIRNSEYKNEVVQIYATSHYKDVSLEEFEKELKKEVEDARHDAQQYNSLSVRRKAKKIEDIRKNGDKFLRVENDSIIVDGNMANLEIVNYKIVNNIYSSQYNMNRALEDTGFVIDEANTLTAPQLQAPTTKKTTFKEAFEAYSKLRNEQPKYAFTKDLRLERIEYEKPLVRQAYDLLGPDEVRRMNYHVSNIRRAVIAKGKQSDDVKIVRMLNIPKQTAVPVSEIKEELQKAYDALGIKRNAKATDLAEWYEIKKSTKRIEGKSTACITIIHAHISL